MATIPSTADEFHARAAKFLDLIVFTLIPYPIISYPTAFLQNPLNGKTGVIIMSVRGEKVATKRITANPNLCVPLYLMASYAYYVEDNPIFSDDFFDRLGRKLLKKWGEIDHYHKSYLNADMLAAGTFLGDYPSIVSGAVADWNSTYD